MAAVLPLLVALPRVAHAERQLVDRVVAQVDDESILLSEVLQEMNLIRLQRNIGDLDEDGQKKLFQSVLNDMIADQLLVAQAKSKGFEINDEDLRQAVDEAIRNIKDRMGGEEAYRAELQRQGLTEAEVRDLHKDQKRKQMLAARVIQSDIRKQISVPDDQVHAFYESHKDSLPPELLNTPETVRLADILVAPHPDEKKVAAARSRSRSVVASSARCFAG